MLPGLIAHSALLRRCAVYRTVRTQTDSACLSLPVLPRPRRGLEDALPAAPVHADELGAVGQGTSDLPQSGDRIINEVVDDQLVDLPDQKSIGGVGKDDRYPLPDRRLGNPVGTLRATPRVVRRRSPGNPDNRALAVDLSNDGVSDCHLGCFPQK
jgi:hypothetical protein